MTVTSCGLGQITNNREQITKEEGKEQITNNREQITKEEKNAMAFFVSCYLLPVI